MPYRLLFALSLFLICAAGHAQNGNLSISITGTATCGCDGCFNISINGGQPPYVLLWSNGQVSNVNGSPTVLCGWCPGQYNVTVTNASTQQTASATGQILDLAFVPLDIIALNPAPCNSDSLVSGNPDCQKVCAGSTVTYTVSGNPNTTGLLDWQVSGALHTAVEQPFGKKITVTWGSPGSGSIQVVSNGVQNCVGEDYACITIVEPPAAIIGSYPAAVNGTPFQVCKGQIIDFQNLSTGDADYYEWLFSDDLSSSSAQDPQHAFLNPGMHTVTLVAQSLCLCADTTVLQIEVLDAPAPVLDCVATICPGETIRYSTSNACPPFVWSVSPNGTILAGGTNAADSITVQWTDGPNGTISLSATACNGSTCPIAGITHIPIVSDNAEIRGEERVCPGATAVYSMESLGGVGFVWTLSGGGIITEGQGTNRISIDWQHTANAATTYWLSVKYDNCYLGCGGQDSMPVKILPAFGLNGPVEACLDANGVFTSKFTNNNLPISCDWTLSGPTGNLVWSSATPTASATAPFTDGMGYYRLFATPSIPYETCSDGADWAIHVKPRPAKLTGIKGIRKICPGNTYAYEAEGGTPESNYFWTVQNGGAGPFYYSGKSLNVTWNASGPRWLSVAQVSSDGLSCQSDTLLLQVESIAMPVINGMSTVCEDNKGHYFIDPVENVDLEWDISPLSAGTVATGQGTVDVEIFWYQPGVHQVTMTVCGLTDTFFVTVATNPDPMVLAPGGLCVSTTGLVETATSFASYAWKNGSGSLFANTASVVLGSGSYAVEVVDTLGCRGSSAFFIEHWDAPEVSLTTASPTGFCNNTLWVPLTALTNTDGDYLYQWFQDGMALLGETALTYTTNQYGNYTVQATNAHGCSNVAGPIRLYAFCGGGGQGILPCNGYECPPGTVDMAIDPTARCDSFQMHLLDPNNVLMPGSTYWRMGISGGTVLETSTDTDPFFTVPNAGEYVAILVVRLTDSTVCNVHEFFDAETVARFNTLAACPGDTSIFRDISEYLPNGGISSWMWDFGDPASGAANQAATRHPTHRYATPGNYTTTLTVTGTSGCTASSSSTIEIQAPPDITFAEPAFKCTGNALKFTAVSNATNITAIAWNFGDAGSGASNESMGAISYHTFSPAGLYTSFATATNVYGCTATFTKNIAIVPNNLNGAISPPVPPAICEGGSITLTAPTGGVSYLWSDESANTTRFLTVGEEGVYRVTMTDAAGCTYAPPAVTVEVNASPDAVIKALLFNDLNQIVGTSYPSTTVCEGEDVVLQAVSNSAYNFAWSAVNGNSPLLYFTDERDNTLATGQYTYTVTVTNPATGCTAVAAPFVVTVHPVPSGFSITGTGVCAGSPHVLSYSGPQNANWQTTWNTGLPGDTLITETPGVYQLRVINEFGCDMRSNTWTLLPGPPVASIPAGCHTRCNPDTLCLPVLPTIIGWQWYQNGLPIPGAIVPNFVAQQSGTYWAQLTDIFGCTAQSEPLSLDLYNGYGNILGNVWSDVNNNGSIDAGDTLVPGIPVALYQNGILSGNTNAGNNGAFAFTNVPSTLYTVEIDAALLSPYWQVVIGQASIPLSGCGVTGAVNLLVRLNCPVVETLDISVCQGDSISYQGVSIAAGSAHTFHYTNLQGCDSTLLVQADALPTSTGTAVLFACLGGTAAYAGVDIPVGTTRYFTLTNWIGCDSILAITVAALPTSTGSTTLFACPGSAAIFGGVSIPVGATQVFTLQNWQGCDSILTVNVEPLTASTGSTTLFACPGSAAIFGGVSIPVGTTQVFTLQNAQGCDSILTVTVAALPASTGSTTLFACPGSAAMFGGVSIPVGTTQVFTLQNAQGCDSILTVIAAPLTASSATITKNVCPKETFVFQGVPLGGGTTQTFVLQNWLGCDSTVTVVVSELPAVTMAVEAHRTCSNTPTGSLEAIVSGGGLPPFQFSLDSVHFQDNNLFDGLEAGTYQIYVKDTNGCLFDQNGSVTTIPPLEVVLNDTVLPCDSVGVSLAPMIAGGDSATTVFDWWNGTHGATTLATASGPVWVEVADACSTVRREATIAWADGDQELSIVYVPNVFKPTSSNVENAVFKPIFGNSVSMIQFRFRIFDRWGDLLFETQDTADGWDGILKGQAIGPGVQVWHLEADVSFCGRVVHLVKKGDVTVVR